MTTISLHVRALRALAKHIAAKNDIRFYLNGVLAAAHPDGTIYVATDGHTLAAYLDRHDDAKPAAPIIFDRESLAALPIKAFGGIVRADADEFRPGKYLLLGRHLLPAIECDGSFPDYTAIFKQLDDVALEQRTTAQLQPEFAMAMRKCVADLTQRRVSKTYVRLTHFGPARAVLAHTEHDSDFLAAIMPMRSHSDALEKAPAWATVPTLPKKATRAPDASRPQTQPEEAHA